MLLAVDIGNSSIKFGVFDKNTLTSKFSIPTKRDYSADDIARVAGEWLTQSIDAAIVCSVVPEVETAVAGYLSHFLHVEPRFVETTDDFGLEHDFAIDTMGTDRLVNSFAAVEKYGSHGSPVIVVSLGTATTIDVVVPERRHIGGLIAPGLGTSAQALNLATSKLPDVPIAKPPHVIAIATETAIQSGIFYGQAAMVDGLLKRVTAELREKPTIIATGGFAEIIAPEVELIEVVDLDLTLSGLQILLQRSCP